MTILCKIVKYRITVEQYRCNDLAVNLFVCVWYGRLVSHMPPTHEAASLAVSDEWHLLSSYETSSSVLSASAECLGLAVSRHHMSTALWKHLHLVLQFRPTPFIFPAFKQTWAHMQLCLKHMTNAELFDSLSTILSCVYSLRRASTLQRLHMLWHHNSRWNSGCLCGINLMTWMLLIFLSPHDILVALFVDVVFSFAC